MFYHGCWHAQLCFIDADADQPKPTALLQNTHLRGDREFVVKPSVKWTLEQSMSTIHSISCHDKSTHTMNTHVHNGVAVCTLQRHKSYKVLYLQTALEEAVADGDAAKGLLQMERDSTALLAKARQAAVEVNSLQSSLHACHAHTKNFMHNSDHQT